MMAQGCITGDLASDSTSHLGPINFENQFLNVYGLNFGVFFLLDYVGSSEAQAFSRMSKVLGCTDSIFKCRLYLLT